MGHHLMGVAEIAAYLGVSKTRAGELARREDFPRPTAQLAAGSVWETAAVEAWNATRNRRPGRPRKGTP